MDLLHRQREDMEDLNAEEREAAMELDGETEPDVEGLARRILRDPTAPLLRRLHY